MRKNAAAAGAGNSLPLSSTASFPSSSLSSPDSICLCLAECTRCSTAAARADGGN